MLLDVDELVLAHALAFLDYASHVSLTLADRPTGAFTAPVRQQFLHRSFVRVPDSTAGATPPAAAASGSNEDGEDEDDDAPTDWARFHALLEQPGVSKLSFRCSESDANWCDRLTDSLSPSVTAKITSVRVKQRISSGSAPAPRDAPPAQAAPTHALLAALHSRRHPSAADHARVLESWRQLTVLLPRLNAIDLSGIQVTSIAWLTEFPRLKSLALDAAKLANYSALAPLRALTSLEALTLVNVMAPDVAFLAGMTQLKKLAIRERSVLRDVSAIRHLSRLQVLSLRYLSTVTDLTYVQELTALQKLDVICVGESVGIALPTARPSDVNSKTPLLHQLTALRLQMVTLQNLDVLTLCPNLRTFVLHRAKTTSLDKFAAVPALRTLTLGIDDLKNLTLYSQRGPIKTSALPGLPSLETLSVPSLDDYALLFNQHPKLSSLALQQCWQGDVDRVATLAHQLSTLSLTYAKLRSTDPSALDVAPLAALTRLHLLRVAGTMVRDVDPLRALTNLRKLELPLPLSAATSAMLESADKELFTALPLLQAVTLTH